MVRALAEHGVRPDLVLGTSIGALNGAFIAADPGARGRRAAGRGVGGGRARGRLPRQPHAPGGPGRAVPHPSALQRTAAARARALPAGRALRGPRGALPVRRRVHRGRERPVVRGRGPRRPGRRVVLGARPLPGGAHRASATTSTVASCTRSPSAGHWPSARRGSSCSRWAGSSSRSRPRRARGRWRPWRSRSRGGTGSCTRWSRSRRRRAARAAQRCDVQPQHLDRPGPRLPDARAHGRGSGSDSRLPRGPSLSTMGARSIPPPPLPVRRVLHVVWPLVGVVVTAARPCRSSCSGRSSWSSTGGHGCSGRRAWPSCSCGSTSGCSWGAGRCGPAAPTTPHRRGARTTSGSSRQALDSLMYYARRWVGLEVQARRPDALRHRRGAAHRAGPARRARRLPRRRLAALAARRAGCRASCSPRRCAGTRASTRS